ncbi:divalent-cation tolerance protein CutA [Phenylobacterium sp.]|uniref:divalent-cation tolerance protein CutA n=1 Tax=Phenylobacterium sp. TaxID=1871053 RepID=UPI002BC2649A|nr:divalent-cation tolerance protein CutA [Phenylobacterium sp.]HVI32776.1 divalent-cation tolerance protein CutA [Phenylobacterium sp.]
MSVASAILIQTTTASETEADAIAEALLSERLAACVQVMPIRSRYLWEGEVRRDVEELLLVKTRADLWDKVAARIRELHSYDTPEIVALPVVAADPAYLAWIGEVTGS